MAINLPLASPITVPNVFQACTTEIESILRHAEACKLELVKRKVSTIAFDSFSVITSIIGLQILCCLTGWMTVMLSRLESD